MRGKLKYICWILADFQNSGFFLLSSYKFLILSKKNLKFGPTNKKTFDICQRISPPTNLAAVLRDLPSSLQSLPSQKLNSQERSQPIQLLQLFKQLLLILGTSNIFLASTFSSFEMRLFIACK